jgi:hypothetical protein
MKTKNTIATATLASQYREANLKVFFTNGWERHEMQTPSENEAERINYQMSIGYRFKDDSELWIIPQQTGGVQVFIS